MIQPSTKGFFFIESSLAIIASIGILSAALFPSMTAYMKRSRDAARISNIYEISTALSTYYADTESYPPPEKGCLPVDVLKKYFLRNVPNDPNTGRLSGYCDGKNGTTYGYGTYTKIDGLPGYYLIADMENANGGNAYYLPSSEEIRPEFFDSLTKGQGRYYILSR